MCKLFAVVEIESQKNAELFAKRAIPYITKIDDHGLGIMRLGERGVHIQRWLEPPKVLRKKQSKALDKYYKALRHQQNETGTKSDRLDAIAIHGRFATCARTLENVHPFFKDGTALMHNGIITNPEKFTRTLSTCDSEVLLSQYLEQDVRTYPANLAASLEGVSGYYAAMAFSDNGNIDIWRDDTATLFIAHVRGVGVVIATTAEIILQTAKRCKAYVSGIDEMLPNVSIRWTRGHNPQISTFAVTKPVEIWPTSYHGTDIIERHKNSVSDATADAEEHWWNQHDYPKSSYADQEERRIAEWQRQEEEDDRKLKELQGTLKGE